MSGHVAGDNITHELAETERITKTGGMTILIPVNIDADNGIHKQIPSLGYSWGRFIEAGESYGSGYKRK